ARSGMLPPPVRFQISAPEGVDHPFATVSPDGRRIAITDDDGGQIWIRDLSSVVAHPLPNTDAARAVVWSPHSCYLIFTSGGKLRKVLVPDGSPETVCDALSGYPFGSWSSRGTILFNVGENPGKEGIYAVAAQGGTPAKLPLQDESGAELLGFYPQFLPDGQHFIFVGRHASYGQELRDAEGHLERRSIYVGDVATGNSRRLIISDSRAEYAAPGYLLFIREGMLVAQAFDINKLKVIGDVIP